MLRTADRQNILNWRINMNYIDFMKSGGIHIKEKNKGKFTKSAKRAGKSVQEHATDVLNDPNATRLQKRRAQFAKNAKKFHHEDGGVLFAQTGASIGSNYVKGQQQTTPEKLIWEDSEKEKKEITKSDSQASSSSNSTDWIDDYIGKLEGGIQTTSTSVPAESGEVMQYLMEKGFNKEAAAGITGVFMAESGLKPGITNTAEDAAYGSTAGRGLGQWSNERRKQYDAFLNGASPTIQTDIDFFIQDLESRPLVKQALANASSVEDAVKAMHLGYENGSSGAMATPEQLTQTYSKAWSKLGYGPYSYNDSHNKRFNYAQSAYQSI